MSFDFIGSSSEPLFSVFIIGLSELDFLSFFLQFDKAGGELISLIGKFPHLTEKNNICEIQSAVLVVVREVSLRVWWIHEVCVC